MPQKLHNDPLVYRAYGTVRGTYKPSLSNPNSGTLTTDDGVEFPATINDNIAALWENDPEKLTSMALWKCHFRTRPASLQLKGIRTQRVAKNRDYSFKVNRFFVDGKVLKLNKESVSVQLIPNFCDGKPFTLTLKGTFDYDDSWQFWRFYLQRQGKTYVIEKAAKLPLPPVEKPKKEPTPPKQQKKKPPQDKQPKKQGKIGKQKKQPAPISTSTNLFKKKPAIKPVPTNPESNTVLETPKEKPKKRVFKLIDKLK